MSVDFNLNRLFELAEQDMAAFEMERNQLINDFIDQGCNKRLLNGLQFRINMERRRAKNPLDACVRISRMMNEQFYSEFCPSIRGLNMPGQAKADEQNESPPPRLNAKIIPFRPNQDNKPE